MSLLLLLTHWNGKPSPGSHDSTQRRKTITYRVEACIVLVRAMGTPLCASAKCVAVMNEFEEGLTHSGSGFNDRHEALCLSGSQKKNGLRKIGANTELLAMPVRNAGQVNLCRSRLTARSSAIYNVHTVNVV